MTPHSSTLAWKIPWVEESGGLQSMGSLRVRHDWATSLSLLSIGEGNGNPLLENPRDGGAWWAAVYGVTQSRTWLKQLSSSSSRSFLLYRCSIVSLISPLSASPLYCFLPFQLQIKWTSIRYIYLFGLLCVFVGNILSHPYLQAQLYNTSECVYSGLKRHVHIELHNVTLFGKRVFEKELS